MGRRPFGGSGCLLFCHYTSNGAHVAGSELTSDDNKPATLPQRLPADKRRPPYIVLMNPTSTQYRVNFSSSATRRACLVRRHLRLRGSTWQWLLPLQVEQVPRQPSKHDTFTKYWAEVGPASTTLGQPQPSIGQTVCVCYKVVVVLWIYHASGPPLWGTACRSLFFSGSCWQVWQAKWDHIQLVVLCRVALIAPVWQNAANGCRSCMLFRCASISSQSAIWLLHWWVNFRLLVAVATVLVWEPSPVTCHFAWPKKWQRSELLLWQENIPRTSLGWV